MYKIIILGIFYTKDFLEIKKKYQASEYPFLKRFTVDVYYSCNNIIKTVALALSRCDKCYFILTKIKFPFNSETSYTCKELEFILDHPILLDKVIFVLNRKELSKEEALTYLKRTDLIQT